MQHGKVGSLSRDQNTGVWCTISERKLYGGSGVIGTHTYRPPFHPLITETPAATGIDDGVFTRQPGSIRHISYTIKGIITI